MLQVCLPTSDVEHGLMAVASVGGVGGDTAENPSIHLPHGCYLENSHWQESVSGHRGYVRCRWGDENYYKYAKQMCMYSICSVCFNHKWKATPQTNTQGIHIWIILQQWLQSMDVLIVQYIVLHCSVFVYGVTCCPWCWEVLCLSPRWCWPQVLHWSDIGSEQLLPHPQTWTLDGCET